MARVFQSGFENGELGNTEWIAGSGSPVIESSSPIRSGSYSLKCPTGAAAYVTASPFANTAIFSDEIYGRAYIYIDGSPTTGRTIIYFGGTSQLSLVLATTRKFQVYAGGVQKGETTDTVPTGQWVLVQWHVKCETSSGAGDGYVEIKIDNGSTYTTAGFILATGQAFGLACGPFGSLGANIWFDDVALNSPTGTFNNSWPGHGKIVNIKPDGDSTPLEWTATGGSTHYTEIDDAGTPDTTTYISVNTTGSKADTWTFSDLASGVGPIAAVMYGVSGQGDATLARTARLDCVAANGGVVNGTSVSWNVNNTWKVYYGIAIPQQQWDSGGSVTGVALDKTFVDGLKARAVDTDSYSRLIKWTIVWASVDYQNDVSLAGAPSGSASASGTLSSMVTAAELAATPSGAGTATGALTTAITAAAAATGAGTAAGALTTAITAAGAAAGAGTTTGALTSAITMAAAASGAATVVGALTTGDATRFGGTIVSDNGTGVLAWNDPGFAGADDQSYAWVQNDISNRSSYYLKATNFGFSLPSNASISGIAVTIRGYADGYGAGTVVDNAVRIVKGGVVGSTNKAAGGNWSETESNRVYGGSSDLWGETWSYSDINATNFGVVLSVTLNSNGLQADCYVDYITVTVYYTAGSQTFAGTVTGSATAVGALTSSITAAGAAAGSATVVGALTTAITAAAAAAGAGTAAGALTTSIRLAATPSGAATVAGALTTAIRCAAAPAGAATVAGALTTSIPLAATPAGAATVAGALTTAIQMAAALTGAGTLVGDLGGSAPTFAAAPAGSATVVGALTTAIRCAAAPAGAATVAGALTTQIRLASAAAGAGSTTGALTSAVTLAAALAGSATAAGSLTTAIRLAAALSGAGTASATFGTPSLTYLAYLLAAESLTAPTAVGESLLSPGISDESLASPGAVQESLTCQ